MVQQIQIHRQSKPLFKDWGEKTIYDSLMKAPQPKVESKQGTVKGERKEHPFDMVAMRDFKNYNIHHSTCIETKRDSTVGLGFKSDKVSDLLDPLCEIAFEHTLSDVAEDYWQVGNCYFEIRREAQSSGAPIAAIYHLEAFAVKRYQEETGDYHWIIQSGEDGTDRHFARFGDLDDFIEREGLEGEDIDDVSEVIAIPRPTSLSRWYGFPDWLSCTASIELVHCLIQHEFDFFLNRGVPEFMLFALGGNIDPDTWKALENNLKSHIGLGNSFKSSAYNLPAPELTIQLEKLGIDQRQQGAFAEMSDSLAMAIVSAHRVPPLLAGIQIPGKLGATNELPNALMAFQVLVIGQAQRAIQRALANTIGKEVGLSKEDFAFKTILDEIDLGIMDTTSRMRDPAASGRDPAEGLKD